MRTSVVAVLAATILGAALGCASTGPGKMEMQCSNCSVNMKPDLAIHCPCGNDVRVGDIMMKCKCGAEVKISDCTGKCPKCGMEIKQATGTAKCPKCGGTGEAKNLKCPSCASAKK